MKRILAAVIGLFLVSNSTWATPPAIRGVNVSGISTIGATITGQITPAEQDVAGDHYRLFVWSGDAIPTVPVDTSFMEYYGDATVGGFLYQGYRAAINGVNYPQTITTGVSIQAGTTYHYRVEAEHQGETSSYDGTFTSERIPFYLRETDGAAVTVDPVGDELAIDHGGSLAVTPSIATVSTGPFTSSVGSDGLTLTPTADFEGHAIAEFTYPNGSVLGAVVLRATKPSLRVVQSQGDAVVLAKGKGVIQRFSVPELNGWKATVRTGKKTTGALVSTSAIITPAELFKPSYNLGIRGIGLGIPSGGAVFISALTDHGVERALLSSFSALDPFNPYLTQGLRLLSQPGIKIDPYSSARISKIDQVDGNGWVFYTIKLKGSYEPNNALMTDNLGSASSAVLLQTGMLANGKKVSSFETLVSAPSSPAQGRWRTRIGPAAKVTFESGEMGLITMPNAQPGWGNWQTLASTGPVSSGTLAGALITHFYLPAFGYTTVAAMADVAAGGSTQRMLLNFAPDTRVLAVLGEAANDENGTPLQGANYLAIDDPVAGSDGRVAFRAQLAGEGVTEDNAEGLWFAADGSTPKLLARAGSAAAGGGVWDHITSLVLPSVPDPFLSGDSPLTHFQYSLSAPRFVATLRVGVDGVTKENNRGIWGVDSTGTLQLLLRTGQTIEVNGKAKLVKSFRALEGAPHSDGAAHGYDGDGKVAAVVTFTDGKEALLRLALP